MRVLNVVGSLREGGGIETVLLKVFRVMDRAEVEIELCYIGRPEPTLASEFEALGIRVWSCPERPLPGFARRFGRQLAARDPYDVVHAHNSHFGGLAAAAARRCGVPARLVHYHNLTAGHRDDWKRRLFEAWLRGRVLANATGIISITRAGLQHWFPRKWQDDPRMLTIGHGIPFDEFTGTAARDDVRRELGIPADAALFGHVGRFVWQKNHEILIVAARRVVDRQPAARFVLIGDGELRPRIEQLVAQAGLREHFVFTGVRRDVPRLLSALDIFVFPSLVEGFGYAQLEAQAAGVPVVASRIPTAPEALAPVFHEYLCDPHDAAGLAEAMLALYDRTRSDASFSQQARGYAAQFTIQAEAQAILAAWNGRLGAALR